MTHCEALKLKLKLESACRESSKALRAFPRLANGMHCDSVKFSAAYQSAKERYNLAFADLRYFNAQFVKRFR